VKKDYLKLINQINIPCIVLDNDLRVLFTNRAFRKEYNLTTKTMFHKSIKAFVEAGELDIHNIKNEIIKKGNIVTLLLCFHKDKIFKKRVQGSLTVINPHSISDTFFLLTIRDYPSYSKGDIPKDYFMRNQFLINLLEDSIDAIMFVDKNDVIKTWNKGAEAIWGYSKDEIIDRNLSVLIPEFLLKENELELQKKILMRNGFIEHYEGTWLTKSGKGILVGGTRTIIRDERNRILGSSFIVRDISERVNIEEQMATADRLAAVGQLASGFAHEIGTPLNVIAGNAELLLLDLPEDNPMREELDIIIKQADRVSTLLQRLLQFAKRSVGKKEKVDINALIKEIIKFVRKQLQRCNITVKMDLTNDKSLVFGNPQQLEQVVLNIIMNAWQAIEKNGKIKIKTYIMDSPPMEQIYIEIEDTGCGIPKEALKYIFNPFFTTKEPGKGSGLGLSVCHSIIVEHKGEIRVESKVNKGTKFTMIIPRYTPE